MRFAVISDVHGNLPALEAVIADVKEQGVNAYALLGDYIFDFPHAAKIVMRMRELPNAFIVKGNKEGYLQGLAKEDPTTWHSEQMGVIHQTFRELALQDTQYLMALPQKLCMPLDDGMRACLMHVSPLPIKEGGVPLSSGRLAREMGQNPPMHGAYLQMVQKVLDSDEAINAFSDIDAQVVLFGHTHLQWHGYCGGKLVLNPGSVGLPLDFDTRAAYTIIEQRGAGFIVSERRIPYNREALIEHIKPCLRIAQERCGATCSS